MLPGGSPTRHHPNARRATIQTAARNCPDPPGALKYGSDRRLEDSPAQGCAAPSVVRKNASASALTWADTAARSTPGGSAQMVASSLASSAEHGVKNTQ